jgi:thiamine pyrophosphate-dependent acetolactate synthase large subunit-like protein
MSHTFDSASRTWIEREEISMKHLIKDLMTGLSAIGMSAAATKSVAQSLETFGQGGATAPAAMREASGTGGYLFVQQLKAVGVEYVFFNPSTGDFPIFDAMVDEPSIHLIKGVQEGAVVAMADGYARASGKTGIVIVANIGLPNAMTQMVNSWKDQIPILVAVASVEQDALGREMTQETDHVDDMTTPITKWHWQAQSTDAIPETTRRGLKYASTRPSGPVFLALPTNALRGQGKAQIWDQAKFDVPMRIRPDKDDIEKTARMLLEAKNPVVAVGDELTQCNAGKEVLELVELLGLPVVGMQGALGNWSRPFPTKHPLYVGPLLREMRYPGRPDVLLNLGNKFADRALPGGGKMISIRLDPASLARTAPVDLGMVADLRLAIGDLNAAIRSMATQARLKEIAEERSARTAAYTKEMLAFRTKIAHENANRTPIALERIGMELEAALEPDACYVSDADSGRLMESMMSFGGNGKQYISTGPNVLGWGLAAAFGVKLARPNQQVVSVGGDGSFLFSGPQPLWSQARYSAPVINIVLNNKSYNNERNRIWHYGGRQFKTGRDLTCYNGNPDVDFAKTAQAFGVEAETVKEPGKLKDALARAKKVTADGRPYLLEIDTWRDGIGSASAWHPPFSIADARTKKV